MPPRTAIRRAEEDLAAAIANNEPGTIESSSSTTLTESSAAETQTMVDVVGGGSSKELSSPVNAEVLATIQSAARFQVTLSEAEKDDQYLRRMKLLLQLNLQPCHPTTEEAFEEWVDEAACQITRFQLGVGIFQEAWSAVVPKAYVRAVASIPVPTKHEELVDKVAKIFFPSGGYVRKLERDLHNPPRAQTVIEARMWVEDSISRFARLCARWGYPMMLSDEHLHEMALLALPRQREQDIRVIMEQPTLAQIWDRASKQENLNVWHPAVRSGNEPAFAANEAAGEARSPKIPKKKKAVAAIAAESEKKCGRCGQAGHSGKQCPKKTWRCYNCNLIGHLASVCKNFAEKDETGRIQTRVEPKPSGTVVKSSKDRFLKDKMASAEATLKGVRLAGDRKRMQATERRANKAAESGHPAKKRRIEHPAGVAQEEEVEENNDSGSECEYEDTALVGIEEYISELSTRNSVVRVSATVNGVQHILVCFSLKGV